MGLLDSFFGPSQAELDQMEKTTLGLVSVTEEEARRGIISPEEAARRISQIKLDGDTTQRLKDPNLSPSLAFDQSMSQSTQAFRTGLGNLVSDTTRFTFSMVPWQIWVIIGIVAVLYTLPLALSLRKSA